MSGLHLRPFDACFAATVASWVRSDAELFALTPTTPPPLTAEKVIAWTGGPDRAFLLFDVSVGRPLGYAELNSMRLNDEHLWMGHVLLDPALRGRGIGSRFVDLLVEMAFGTLSAERLSLIVFPENKAAVRCYERAGFALRGDEFHRFGPARRRYRMLRYECDRSVVHRHSRFSAAHAPREHRQLLPTSPDRS
jgi:RimJ/RimL family protein N-acetyltransferase